MRVARASGVLVGVLALAIGAGAQAPRPDPRTGLIVGQVVDAANGRPVAGAIVSIGGSTGSTGATRFVRSTSGASDEPLPRILTGSDGRFLFRDLPRGTFTITAAKAGYAPGAYGRRRPLGPSQRVELEAGERVGDIDVLVWKNGSITGLVTDESGEPLAAVQLRSFRRVVLSGRRTFAPAREARTDDRGVYRLGDLTPGEYVVAASLHHLVMPLAPGGGMRVPGRSGYGSTGMSLPGSPGAIRVGDVVYGLGVGNPTPPPPEDDRLSI